MIPVPELRITTAEAAKGNSDFRRISGINGEDLETKPLFPEAADSSLFLKLTMTGLELFWIKVDGHGLMQQVLEAA